jgi:hypothetical protein
MEMIAMWADKIGDPVWLQVAPKERRSVQAQADESKHAAKLPLRRMDFNKFGVTLTRQLKALGFTPVNWKTTASRNQVLQDVIRRMVSRAAGEDRAELHATAEAGITSKELQAKREKELGDALSLLRN